MYKHEPVPAPSKKSPVKKRQTGKFEALTKAIIQRCHNYKGKRITEEMMRRYKDLFEKETHAIAAMMLEGYDLPKGYAIYFADKPQYDEIAAYLATVPEQLSRLSPDEAVTVFLSVTKEKWKGVVKRIREISGWLRFIPTELGDVRRIRLATFIGRVAAPPKRKEEISEKLERSEETVLQILFSENVDQQILDDHDYLMEYAISELPTEVRRPHVQVTYQQPHESVEIPDGVASHLLEQGISPDDVVRMIVYGLKLNSAKAARGGKYFPVEQFRKYSESALEPNGIEITKRREEVEKFLLRHGVIATYKQGDVIRLNIKDDGGSIQPTELGKHILKSIIGWMNRFQRETANSAA